MEMRITKLLPWLRSEGGERMIELKLCPFCGGEAHVERATVSNTVKSRTSSYVECDACGACGEGFVEDLPPEEVERMAIEAWNRRTERTCRAVNVDREDEKGRLHRLFHRCSECGHDLPYEAENGHGCYCPSCGAKVVE